MNFSTVLGFGLAIAVFLHSVLTSTDNWGIFMNEHGLIIVIGGTLAAGTICFPIKKVITLGLLALKRMLFGVHIHYPDLIKSLITFALL